MGADCKTSEHDSGIRCARGCHFVLDALARFRSNGAGYQFSTLYYVNFNIGSHEFRHELLWTSPLRLPGNETGDLHETGVSALSKLNNHITIIFQPLDS